MVPTTDYGRTLFALWFSNVFLTFRSSSVVRVLGAERRTSTCAARRGPRPSGRVVPWNGPPPHMPGVARGARIPRGGLIFLCFSKVFTLPAGQSKSIAFHMLF